MHSFFNSEFDAPNVLKFTFPENLIADAKTQILESEIFDRLMKVQPNWKSDISWLSPNSLTDFTVFNNIFDQLNISKKFKESLGFSQKLVSYCGFLVVRSECTGIDFHTDWIGTGLSAFTLITPLVDEGNDLGLLYKKTDSTVGKYLYKPGEAIVFADGFIHSSMPSESSRNIILLSFTFGFDDMALWPAISKTAGYQSNLLRLPNGDFRIKHLDKCHS